jgi:hypothetical protein
VIIVDILLVDQRDVFCCAVVAFQVFDAVLLNRARFLDDALIRVCDIFREKAFPFAVGEGITVEPFDLRAEVGNQVIFLSSASLW